MRNWGVDIEELKKHKKEYAIWRLEQMVNFGIGQDKLNKSQLKKYWPFLHLDPKKKKFISMLLWPAKQS